MQSAVLLGPLMRDMGRTTPGWWCACCRYHISPKIVTVMCLTRGRGDWGADLMQDGEREKVGDLRLRTRSSSVRTSIWRASSSATLTRK